MAADARQRRAGQGGAGREVQQVRSRGMNSENRRFGSVADEPWRVFRIMAEFVDGFDVLGRLGPGVSVFGSARTPGNRRPYQQAVEMGRRLAEEGFAVITGGGPGIMEAANKGAFEAGGTSLGLNITIPQEQKANPYLNIRLDFKYFFARKVMFVKYAVALVCFPGGFGTLDELFETLTLIQTQKTPPSPVVLIGSEYWSPLVNWFRGTLLEEHQAISPEDLDLVMVTDDVEEAVAHILRKYRQAGPLWEPPAGISGAIGADRGDSTSAV
jgi:uncharacterized protein (TIGR00730 family)